MKLAVFRTQEHVPDVYPRNSRDFQLFCNLFDCLNGGLKYDIDSILDVVDTNQCNERLIPYLQTKLGFFTNVKIPASHLRTILKAFPHIVKNKGSLKGVEWAVRTFLKTKNINTAVNIRIDNSTHTVYIGTEERLYDTEILEEILRYVLPAGYELRYIFYTDTVYSTKMQYQDSVSITVANLKASSVVRRNHKLESLDPIEISLPGILSNVNTTPIASKTVRNENQITEVSKMAPFAKTYTNKITKSTLWE